MTEQPPAPPPSEPHASSLHQRSRRLRWIAVAVVVIGVVVVVVVVMSRTPFAFSEWVQGTWACEYSTEPAGEERPNSFRVEIRDGTFAITSTRTNPSVGGGATLIDGSWAQQGSNLHIQALYHTRDGDMTWGGSGIAELIEGTWSIPSGSGASLVAEDDDGTIREITVTGSRESYRVSIFDRGWCDDHDRCYEHVNLCSRQSG